MQFEKTQTYQNLARAFAGECQAGMRYQMIAKLAMQEKLKTLSDAIKKIAKNETLHATQFFNAIQEKAGAKRISISTQGILFMQELLQKGLISPKKTKRKSPRIVPTFADIAEEEGFKDVATLFRLVAKVEEQHQAVFHYLANAVKDGTLYKCDSPILWICSECGHMHVSTEAWKVCPLCKAGQGYVELHLPFEGVKY